MILLLISGLIIGASSVIFALQNIFPVTVTFMVWELTTSLAVIVSLSIFAGVLISSLFSIPSSIKNMFQIARINKENKRLQEELDAVKRANEVHIAVSSDLPIEKTGL